MTASASPLILAVVSGKGGVGKTMLAVAIANELSRSSRTLLIDLDFFNRGLTGLMASLHREQHEVYRCTVAKPTFLAEPTAEQLSDDAWHIVTVSDNLYHLVYEELTVEETQKFESLPVDQLFCSFTRFVEEAAIACRCDCVVLDCHGGPDNSSFAACLVANHSLLVSEPDRITLFGTLNFLRSLREAAGNGRVDVRLVFNKVVPAFSSFFLIRFYNAYLREEFNRHSLLAIYPFEPDLTKAFERTPFLTSSYPYSLLARKTRVLLRDLLISSAPNRLTRTIRNTSALRAAVTRWTLGKTFFLADTSFVLPTIAAGVIFAAAIFVLNSAFVVNASAGMKLHVERLLYIIALDKEAFDQSEEVDSRYIAFMEEFLRSMREGDNSKQQRKEVHRGVEFYERLGQALGQPVPLPTLDSEFVDLAPELASGLDDYAISDRYEEEFEESVREIRKYSSLFAGLVTLHETLEEDGRFLIGLAGIWFMVSVVWAWTNQVDTAFTYFLRQNAYLAGLAIWGVLLAVWLLPMTLVGFIVGEAPGYFVDLVSAGAWVDIVSPTAILGLVVCAVGLGVLVSVGATNAVRVYVTVRYERQYIEGLLRCAFLGYLVTAGLLSPSILDLQPGNVLTLAAETGWTEPGR